jgi:hypothetical protein
LVLQNWLIALLVIKQQQAADVWNVTSADFAEEAVWE